MKKNSNQLSDFIRSHKALSATICCFVVLALIACVSNTNKPNDNHITSPDTPEVTTDNSNKKDNADTDTNEDPYMDALRKCTVMEGADIYTTGIGRKSDNSFNDARITCESWYSQWGEDDFFNAVYTDWENRKTEQIDGEPLTYYLDILGW